MSEPKSYSIALLENLTPLFLGLIAVWLVVLSFLFYWLLSHYQRLAGKAKGEDLKKILDQILKTEKINEKELKELGKRILELEKEKDFPLQKVGLVRFSPFNETGGDQSFCLAALNAQNTGFVITGLHARERTRVYVKSVKGGKGQHQLSKEEQWAIREAKK